MKNNIIVISGPIGIGKSTLIGALPFIKVAEYDPTDELQKTLLQGVYDGDPVAIQVFQLDMINKRFNAFKKNYNSEKVIVFDRFIFEDYLFAKRQLKYHKPVLKYFTNIYKDMISDMKEKYTMPGFHIILDAPFEEVKDRIFKRQRKEELDKFDENLPYFKELHENYQKELIETLEDFKTPYEVVDVSGLNSEAVYYKVRTLLEKKGYLE